MRNSDGFSAVEGILIIIVVMIIGSVGYLGYQNFVAPKPISQNSVSANSTKTESPSTEPFKVENSTDLDSALTSLDSTSLDDSDAAQLNSATSSF